jgi:fructokinase
VKIAAFGELLWDLLPNGKVLGGAPANFIYRINSFGDEGTLLSKVGNDKAGREAHKGISLYYEIPNKPYHELC